MTERFRLSREKAALVIVDVQEKLVPQMKFLEQMEQNIKILIASARRLGIPILMTEQYPKGLGGTIAGIAGELPDVEPVAKVTFSCWGDEAFRSRLEGSGRKQVILTGIETHVCVVETTLDLLAAGYSVYLPTDALCSRRKQNWQTGLRLARSAGAVLTCTETVFFQLLGRSDTPEFKELINLLK